VLTAVSLTSHSVAYDNDKMVAEADGYNAEPGVIVLGIRGRPWKRVRAQAATLRWKRSTFYRRRPGSSRAMTCRESKRISLTEDCKAFPKGIRQPHIPSPASASIRGTKSRSFLTRSVTTRPDDESIIKKRGLRSLGDSSGNRAEGRVWLDGKCSSSVAVCCLLQPGALKFATSA
jgi:hypothetical protein